MTLLASEGAPQVSCHRTVDGRLRKRRSTWDCRGCSTLAHTRFSSWLLGMGPSWSFPFNQRQKQKNLRQTLGSRPLLLVLGPTSPHSEHTKQIAANVSLALPGGFVIQGTANCPTQPCSRSGGEAMTHHRDGIPRFYSICSALQTKMVGPQWLH